MIATDKMNLKIAVGVRHNLLFRPLLITLGSLIVGLLFAWLTTEFLPAFVSKKLVDADIVTNDARPDNEQIRGLEEWVMLRRRGTSDKSLLPLLKTLLAFGADQARHARERLTQALAASSLHPHNPIRIAAANEAGRPEHSITDFYSDGTKLERHPADTWILTLNRAQGIQRQLDRARATIVALPPGQQAGLPDLLEDAERVSQEAGDGTGLSFAEETIKDLWRKIHDHIADLPAAARASFFKTLAAPPFHAIQPVVTDRASQLSSPR